MRTIIAVDWDTMKELADEEAQVRAEEQDWFDGAIREEAVRRVVERRGDPRMTNSWRASRRAYLRAIGSKALRASGGLEGIADASGYCFDDPDTLGQLVKDALSALEVLGLYALDAARKIS